jgi:hypothetical protein
LPNLIFSQKIEYPDNEKGIYLDIFLIVDKKNPVAAKVKLDTGADYCVFQKIYADFLDIEVETGNRKDFRTANSNFTAFGHEVSIQFLDFEFMTTVYFVTDEGFRVSVLGRMGFLDQFQIGLIDYERLLFIETLENYYQ